MNAKQTLLEKIKDGSFALLTADEIAAKLRLKGKAAAGLNDILFTLCREGELLRDLRGRLGTAEQFGAVRGTISGNERGFGFFVPDDPTAEDLFIPHRALRGAYHGDTVLAFRKGGRAGDEGEVLAVLKRGCDRLVGLFRRERSGGFVHPDEKKFCDDIFVPSDRCKGAASGTKVVVRIYNFEGKTPKGEIVEVLGEGGDFFVEELSLIRSHNLKEEFPAEVLEEAERQAQRDPLESIAGRIDLRDELIITVDGEDTRDIDDAISIRKENGKYYLGVHIADVTHYVKWKGVLDHEHAPHRALQQYLFAQRGRAAPDAFLLHDGRQPRQSAGTQRCALRHLLPPPHDLHRRDGDCRRLPRGARPLSRHRGVRGNGVEFVETATELTKILKRAREGRGGVALDVKEAKILYEDGKISIPDYQRTISHEMIEQFMVLANESVATIMTEKKMPFVYRIHERPNEEKAEDFRTFLTEAGVHVKFDPSKVSPADYQELLRSLEDSPLYSLVNRVMLRSMMKAVYSPENVGHRTCVRLLLPLHLPHPPLSRSVHSPHHQREFFRARQDAGCGRLDAVLCVRTERHRGGAGRGRPLHRCVYAGQNRRGVRRDHLGRDLVRRIR